MLLNLWSGRSVMGPLARGMWWYVTENRGEMRLSLTVCDVWHDTQWAHHTQRHAPCHETLVTWQDIILFHTTLMAQDDLENLNERDDYKYRAGWRRVRLHCLALTRVDVRSVTCDNCHSPGSGWHWHVTVTGSGWRGDTGHMASCNTDHLIQIRKYTQWDI